MVGRPYEIILTKFNRLYGMAPIHQAQTRPWRFKDEEGTVPPLDGLKAF